MNLYWHLLKRELVRAWPWALAVIGLTSVRYLIALQDPLPGYSRVFSNMATLTLLLGVAVQGSILFWVVKMVQADPMGEPRAFSSSRPLPPFWLLFAKLTAAGLVGVLLPVGLMAGWLHYHGVAVFDQSLLLGFECLRQVLFIAVMILVAALTPSFGRVVLWLLGALAVIGLVAGMAAPKSLSGLRLTFGPLVQTFLWAALLTVIYRTRHRGPRPAYLHGVAFLLIAWTVFGLRSWESLPAASRDRRDLSLYTGASLTDFRVGDRRAPSRFSAPGTQAYLRSEYVTVALVIKGLPKDAVIKNFVFEGGGTKQYVRFFGALRNRGSDAVSLSLEFPAKVAAALAGQDVTAEVFFTDGAPIGELPLEEGARGRFPSLNVKIEQVQRTNPVSVTLFRRACTSDNLSERWLSFYSSSGFAVTVTDATETWTAATTSEGFQYTVPSVDGVMVSRSSFKFFLPEEANADVPLKVRWYRDRPTQRAVLSLRWPNESAQ